MLLRDIAVKGRDAAVRLYRTQVDGELPSTQDVPSVDRVNLAFTGCIPDGDELIVRTRCMVRSFGEEPRLRFSLEDLGGRPIAAETVVLSVTHFDKNITDGVAMWEVVASTRIYRDKFPFRMRVADLAGKLAEGCRCLNARRLHRLLSEWGHQTQSAWDDPAYDFRFKRSRAKLAELDLQAQERFACEPLVSIVVPLFHTPTSFFREMVASVMRQSYGKWELVLVNADTENTELSMELHALSDERVRVISLPDNRGIVANTNVGIEAASGDFIAFLDHDDFLEPDALYRYVVAINDHDDADLLYCDEDSYSAGGRFVHPHLKPDFNRDLLYSHNYITHFLVIRTSVIRQVGVSPQYVECAQDYDLTLRALETAREVVHIPRVLYHWRMHPASTSANADSKPQAQEAGRRALADHFERRGLDVDVADGPAPFTYVETYKLRSKPLVSIVIPNKDHVDVLQPCVESVLRRASYDNFEIIVVENNSKESSTFEYYEHIAKNPRVRVIRFEGAFNYSKVVNFGAANARGDFLLFLNNDTCVITPDFIERMLGCCMREEVGVVGIKLLHQDDTVQHAGVYMGPDNAPWHFFMDAPDSYNGYVNRAIMTQNCLAVTGACQMVSRNLFDELGGYDEGFAVAYNDVDFCLKARDRGMACVYLAHVKMYHREFTSRGFDVSAEDRTRFFGEKARLQGKWPQYFTNGDPFVNPNMDKSSLFFGLGMA